MDISVKSILKQSAKFNAVGVISFLFQIPTQLIIGRFLMPNEYGIISLVALWSLYGGLANPGMLTAASREVPYLMGKKENQKSALIQNISITSDIIWFILPFAVILAASFFYQNRVIRIAIVITAINFLLARFAGYWSTFNFAKQKFTIVAVGKLISVAATPIFIIITIFWLKIYAVLAAPILGGALMLIYYLKKGKIEYRWQWNWTEIKKLIKVGIVFNLSALIFYGFQMADRTIIAAYLPLYELGLFTFAMGAVFFAVNFLADFSRVLTPILWKVSGENEDAVQSFSSIKKIAVYFALFIGAGVPLLQLIYSGIIPLVNPNYAGSTIVFNILSLYIFLSALASLPAVPLNSSVVNKQSKLTVLYAIALGGAILLDLALIRMGFGKTAIAAATIFTQIILTVCIYRLAKRCITRESGEFAKLMAKIFAPFAICALFTLFNCFEPWENQAIPHYIISLFLQILVWVSVIKLFYCEYFPRHKFIEIWDGLIDRLRSVVS